MTERVERFSVDLGASPAEVWRMLTTAEGLAAWFGTRARVDLRLDGEVVVGWGDREEIASRIRALEPHRRVRLAHVLDGRDVGAEEWLLTRVDGTTTRLTLVHSMPDDDIEDWDGFYGDVRRGWRLFLASLRHALGDARDPLRRVACRYHPLPGSRARRWAEVEGVLGPLSTGVVTAPLARELEVALVEPPAGVLLVSPARTLLVDLEGHGEHQVLYVQAAEHRGGDQRGHPDWIEAALDLVGRIAGPAPGRR